MERGWVSFEEESRDLGPFSSVLVPPWTAGRGIGDDVMDDGEEIWFDVCCMEYGIRLFLARENGYTR